MVKNWCNVLSMEGVTVCVLEICYSFYHYRRLLSKYAKQLNGYIMHIYFYTVTMVTLWSRWKRSVACLLLFLYPGANFFKQTCHDALAYHCFLSFSSVCILLKIDPHLIHSWVKCENTRLFCTGKKKGNISQGKIQIPNQWKNSGGDTNEHYKFDQSDSNQLWILLLFTDKWIAKW